MDSVITCPACGAQSPEVMPEHACQHFYRCRHCQELLRPRAGDCCVFCSYGTTPCPPKQIEAQNVPYGSDGSDGG